MEEQVIQDIDGNLKQKILDLIERIYCKKYIGTLEVNHINPIGVTVRFGLNNDEKPIYISAELSDDDFMIFIEKELHSRRLDIVKYFLGYKDYPYNCNIDRRCIKCND